jgi:hypothetical protein
VKFFSFKHQTQVKCILIPNSTQRNDVAVLRNLHYKELLAACSIIYLGGSKLTPINDILLLKYDEDYGQAIDLSLSTVFDVLEKYFLVKLRQTEDTALIDDNASKSHDGGKFLMLLFRNYAKFISFALAVIS